MQVYCDSVILMYFLEYTGPFNVRASHRLAALAAAGDQIVVSDIVRLECRVKPIRTGAAVTLAVYDTFFSRSDVTIVPINTIIFERATLIRASHNFKLADSLHLAAAIEFGCDRFLTNDIRLSSCSDITVEVLP